MNQSILFVLSKPFRMLVLAVFALVLCGCVKPVEYTVTLYDGEEVVDVFVVADGNSIVLPTLENQGERIFAAWTDQNTFFADSYEVTRSIDLHAYYEEAEEMFDYTSVEESQTIYIEGYRGVAVHLTIPQTIQEYLVVSIGSNSFQNSALVSVQVPIEATIQMHAFRDSKNLKSVSFYGRYLEYKTMTIANPEYLSTLETYSETCHIVSGSIESGTWSFGEGCPIHTVLSKTTIVVLGVDYVNYLVLWDLNVENPSMMFRVQSRAFLGADNLERVTLAKDESVLMADAFEGCPKLIDIVIPEENVYFTTVDRVVYSKDMETLILYPNGLTPDLFAVPDTVKTIRSFAFMENTTIKELFLPSSVENLELAGLFGLERITVSQDHPILTVVDGVLFDHQALIKYPAKKAGTTYVVPSHIKMLRASAFQGNQFLTTLTLNDGLETIGDQCFRQTQNLLTIDLPASVELLRSQVFLESSVATLIVRRSVSVNGSITRVFLFPLFTMSNDFAIYVPDDSISTYLGDPTWALMHDQIDTISNVPPAV